ncbi:MAG TPA: hypothetical protein PKV97_13530 [Thauera aminoaromatica]|nr:hypothetical protein [Thauera aminoaromatica]
MKHLIKLALFCLAAVAAYLVYGFTALVAPWYVALGAAGSLVGTYIGLAFADVPAAQRPRAIMVARGAMVVEAVYGFLFMLSVQSPEVFHTPLSLYLSVPLSILHGAAFSVLAYFVSLFVVHEARGVPDAAPIEPRDQAIVDALGAVVEVSRAVLARLDEPRSIAAPEPIQAVPLLEQDVDQTIQVGGKAVSLRKLAEISGKPLTSLRREIEKL